MSEQTQEKLQTLREIILISRFTVTNLRYFYTKTVILVNKLIKLGIGTGSGK